jgi:hypothetical protein
VTSPQTDAAGDLEVTMVFDPTRISKQMLELAYELALPIERRQFHPVRDPNQVDQSQIRRQEATYHEEEVA